MEEMTGIPIDEARRVPPKEGMHHVGWLWRSHRGTNRWVYTTTLSNRAYPDGSEFIPVYINA